MLYNTFLKIYIITLIVTSMIYFTLKIFHDFISTNMYKPLHVDLKRNNIKCQCQWIINKQLLHNC